jgi:poly(A) polymerase
MIPQRLSWLLEPDGVPVQLSRLFIEAGHRLYLVGGSMRDALLDRPHFDLDFATDARPDQIKAVVADWADTVFTVGEAFGTIGVVKGGHTHEVTTFRSEVYHNDSRKPQVAFSNDLEVDLSRRDFTVNAIAVQLPDPELIDPYGGLGDLSVGVLRTPLAPEESFSDDPLRMLRLFRFMATLGFEPDPAALEAVVDMADRLAIVSAERIRDEFSKLLVAPQPGRALMGIVRTGLAAHVVPELVELEMAQDPVHRHKDVLAHTIAVVDKTEPKLELRLAALLHDVGKPATRQFSDGGATFHHHEVVGARIARQRLRELRYPKQIVADVSELVFLHLRPHTFKMGWTDSAVRRYVRDAGPLLRDLNQLVRCDVTTRNQARAREIQDRIDELEERIAVLSEKEHLESLRPPIDGNEVMAYLGIPAGPRIGEVMHLLTEHRIDQGPYEQEEAYRLVREWALEQAMEDPGEKAE